RAVCMPYFGGASLSPVLKALWAKGARPTRGAQLVEALERVSGPRPAGAEPPAGVPLHHLRQRDFFGACAWVAARLAEGSQRPRAGGVSHRALKPANILLTADGVPMLLDFNLAHNQSRPQVQASLGGTVAYMAPEQLRALAGQNPELIRQVDHRADLYG